MEEYVGGIFDKSNRLRAQARNNPTTLLVFVSVYGVTSTGTYPDMHRWMCLV